MIWVWTLQTLLIATAFHLVRAQGRPASRREMWEVVIANGASGVLHAAWVSTSKIAAASAKGAARLPRLPGVTMLRPP